MKQTCFYSTNNLHELEQSDLPVRKDEGMLVLPTQKKSLLKKRNYILAFCLAMAFSSSMFAVDLQVSGIASPYDGANGIYHLQADLKNGKSYWVHESGNYNIHYALWFDGTTNYYPYWYIDNDYEDQLGLFYGDPVTSPLDVNPWTADQATGPVSVSVYSTVPEINIMGNGTTVASGDNTPSFSDYTKFAATDVSGGISTRTYTIYNTGTVDALSIGTITIGGPDASDFTVTTAPASTVNQSGSTTFIITFNPSSSGEKTATVSIVNNDSDENPYTFTISGYGYTPKNLVVSGITSPAEANGTYIHQGVINDFQYWKHSTLNYYIYYSLSVRNWIIDNNTNSMDNYLFWGFSELYSPTGLTYTPSSPWTGTVVINEEVAVPEIDIKVVGTFSTYTISDGSSTTQFANNTNFGSLEVASGDRTKSYTIQNTGNATLTLSGASPYVSITGTNASDFSITTIPSNSISASGTTTLGITFNPSAIGTRTATVTILSNDADEGVYTFAIQGEGVNPRNLVVSNITAPSAANGTYVYQGLLNEFQYWKHSTENYYIYNSKLNGIDPVWYIDVNTSADLYTSSSYNFYSQTDYVSPVSVPAWTSSSGNSGTPLIQYTEPEINVTGNSANIISGDNTPSLYDYTDLGWVVSGSISKTFTIQNTGIATLNLTGANPYITFSGADASQFSITTIPSSIIAAGGSTTFGVRFTPSSGTLGARTATLSIANDDSNENPYTFSVQSGVGTLPVVTTQAISSIGSTTATGNGNVTSLGSPNPTSYGICYATTSNPDITGSKVDKGTASVTGAFTASMTSLIPNTTYYVRSFVTNNVGTVYGTEVTFTTSGIAPTVTTIDVTNITTTTATGTGKITNLGVPNPTAHGVCWNTTGTPTISDSKTDNGAATVTGAFTTSMTNLSANTTYYVRAYATNTAGTSYGSEVSFTTSPVAPIVTTQAVSSITVTTATGNGNITSLGVPNPTVSGICWNTSISPTTSNFKTTNGPTGVTGAFTGSLTSLSANTTYYVRAYATNTAGTSYGSEVSFTTSPVAPIVTTQAVSSITATTATGNGNITSLGVPNPTAYGVCWNTTGTPTTSDSKIDNGATTITGAFTASMTNLSVNATYYVRAYATNTADTSYGDVVSFKTSGIAPTVTTLAVSSISSTTATGNGNITSLGIPNPTAYGVCWNTTGTPTISDSKTDNGAATVTGAFTTSMTNLSANTTYYVRAYATNTANTSYGDEVSFKTDLGTDVSSLSVNTLSIYPNPTVNGFTMNVGEKANTVSIYNISGSLVLTQQAYKKTYINTSTLAKGVYLVKANGLVGKLVKK